MCHGTAVAGGSLGINHRRNYRHFLLILIEVWCCKTLWAILILSDLSEIPFGKK
jgi:hypothetical protein